MLCVCFYMKLQCNSKNYRFRIVVTLTDKAEDKKRRKKYNMAQVCVLYIIVSLLSRNTMLLALRDETKTAEKETTIYSLLFSSYNLEDHVIS